MHTTGVIQAYYRLTTGVLATCSHIRGMRVRVRERERILVRVLVRVVQGRRCGHVRGRCMRMCEERVCLLRMSHACLGDMRAPGPVSMRGHICAPRLRAGLGVRAHGRLCESVCILYARTRTRHPPSVCDVHAMCM